VNFRNGSIAISFGRRTALGEYGNRKTSAIWQSYETHVIKLRYIPFKSQSEICSTFIKKAL